MRFFADHGNRNIVASANGIIVSAIVASGHYPEIDSLERDRLLAAGWTFGAPHPTSARALGALPPLRSRR